MRKRRGGVGGAITDFYGIRNEKLLIKGKLEFSRQSIGMKFSTLQEVYEGHENILHFLLKCTMKTHTEGVAETMGSVIDSLCQERRGLTIEEMGK